MKHAVCAVLALLCVTLTVRADTPFDPMQQRVPIGGGRTFTVSPAEPLSFRAHVGSVLYQPGSLEAAYTSTVTSGDTVTQSVRLVGLKTAQTWTLCSDTGPADGDDAPSAYELVGWTGDGRYLITRHLQAVKGEDGAPATVSNVYDSVDVGAEPFTVRRIALPDADGLDWGAKGDMMPSPSGKLFAVGWRGPRSVGTPPVDEVFIYDPAKDTLRRLLLPMHTLISGWNDDAHLIVIYTTGAASHAVLYNIATGKETPATKKPASPAPVARAFPEVTLSLPGVPLDIPGPDPHSDADGASLWLAIKGARPKLPSQCLAVFVDTPAFASVLAPNQSSVLWLEHGDLYVRRFGVETASAREKYDAGDALTCDEERDIAMSNAKQIGLGLIQYSQDYDEQYPPAANFHDGVYPYLQNEGLFKTGNVPFQYAAPADLHLSAMDAPADDVLGTISLPCATVTLYADGHVKSLPPSAGP